MFIHTPRAPPAFIVYNWRACPGAAVCRRLDRSKAAFARAVGRLPPLEGPRARPSGGVAGPLPSTSLGGSGASLPSKKKFLKTIFQTNFWHISFLKHFSLKYLSKCFL